MKQLILITLLCGLLAACGQTYLAGPVGPQGAPGVNGTNGAAGINGTNGAAGENGTNGADGTSGSNGTNGATGATGGQGLQGATGGTGQSGISVTPIELCTTCKPVYPSVFAEYALCLQGQLYGVYSQNDGFLALLPPGEYASDGINCTCTLTVGVNCAVTEN